MINENRIVPVTKTDLLTLYGNILTIAGTSVSAVSAVNANGDFVVEATGDAGNVIANEPVKSVDFAEGVTAAVVYFIPNYNYAGFSIDGTDVVTAGATVDPDGVTLYTATLSSSTVTIVKVGF